jgi:mRNA-degrading endonuclease YafQ of YafQ-DinJ toxin-antitoxin module
VKIFNDVRRLAEFEIDLKKLAKRFRTVKEDLENLIKFSIFAYHKLKQDNSGIVRISDLNIDYPKIYKVLKFACRSLKGRGAYSGLRLIYAYYEDKDILELIEIYYHDRGDEIEDRKRIYKYYKKSNS